MLLALGQVRYQLLLLRSSAGVLLSIVFPLLLVCLKVITPGALVSGLLYAQWLTPGMCAFCLLNACYVTAITSMVLAGGRLYHLSGEHRRQVHPAERLQVLPGCRPLTALQCCPQSIPVREVHFGQEVVGRLAQQRPRYPGHLGALQPWGGGQQRQVSLEVRGRTPRCPRAPDTGPRT